MYLNGVEVPTAYCSRHQTATYYSAVIWSNEPVRLAQWYRTECGKRSLGHCLLRFITTLVTIYGHTATDEETSWPLLFRRARCGLVRSYFRLFAHTSVYTNRVLSINVTQWSSWQISPPIIVLLTCCLFCQGIGTLSGSGLHLGWCQLFLVNGGNLIINPNAFTPSLMRLVDA